MKKLIFAQNEWGKFVLENTVVHEKFATYRRTDAGFEWEARIGEKTASGTAEYAADARDAIAFHLGSTNRTDFTIQSLPGESARMGYLIEQINPETASVQRFFLFMTHRGTFRIIAEDGRIWRGKAGRPSEAIQNWPDQIENLNDAMTPAEVEEEFSLQEGSVRASCLRGTLEKHIATGEVRKAGGTWLIARHIAEKKYGRRRGRK